MIMMTDELRQRVAKVYELVNRGGTEGEKAAAKAALDRLMKRYNLSDEMLKDIEKREYRFKYSTDLEQWLFIQLVRFYLNNADDLLSEATRHTWGKREISIKLTYADWVTIECSYEYFRRHMKDQWNKTCAPIVAKCRKPKTRNRKRKQLQDVFFGQYVVKSKLYRDRKELSPIDFDLMTNSERSRYEALWGLEGGDYNKQMTSGLLLEE